MQASTRASSTTRAASSPRRALTALLCVLAAIAALGLIDAGSASAYTNEWRCKPANDTWCYDPEGLFDWHTGEVKLEKGYNAYLCVGVFKEPWSGAAVCTENEVPDGETLEWKFGTAFSAYNPLHGAGLQENSEGNAEEIWNWFYEP